MASQAEIDLIVDASRTLPELERDLDRVLAAAQAGVDDIDVDAAMNLSRNITRVTGDLDRVLAAAQAGADDIDVDAVLNQRRALSGLQADLRATVAGFNATGQVDPVLIQGVLDGRQTLRTVRGELDRVVTAAQATTPDITIRADVDVDDDDVRRLRNVGDTMGRIGGTALRALGPVAKLAGGLALVGAAAGGALPLVAGLVAAVESVAPAAAVGVSGLLTVALAAGTVKLAMIGVEDAVSTAFDPEATPEELAESMKNLAPEARKFVTELSGMKKQFKELQLGVQNRFFKDFDSTAERLGKTVMPSLRTALNRSADSLNLMARGAAEAASELAESGILGKALKHSTNALKELESVPRDATRSLGFLAAAAGPSLERIAKKASDVATRIADSLAKSFKSGELEKAIDAAVDNIAQFGRSVANVFRGIGNIFKGLTADGAGLFDTLEKVTQAFEDLTASKEFQGALKALAETMRTLVETALPLFVDLLKQILPVFEILAPPIQELIKHLGEGLGPVIKKLGPVLESLATAFGKLLPVVEPFIDLALKLIEKILPILTPLFEGLGKVFDQLAPVAEEVANNIGAQLLPILEKLPEILEKVIPKFVDIAEKIFPKLVELLQEIGPELGIMAEEFADILVELVPLVIKFLEFQAFLIEKFGPAVLLIVEGALKSFIGILKFLGFVLEEVVAPAIRIIAALLEGDFSEAARIGQKAFQEMTVRAGSAFTRLKETVVRLMGEQVATVTRLSDSMKQRVVSTVSSMVSRVIGLAGSMQRGFVSRVSELVAGAIRLTVSMPGRILSAIGNLRNLLFSAGADVIRGLINGMSSQLGRLRDIAKKAASIVSDSVSGLLGIGSPSKVFAEFGVNTIEGFIKGIRSQIPDLRSEMRALGLDSPEFVGINETPARFPRIPAPVAPQVSVFLGNRLINDHIDVRVSAANRIRDRVTAQGTRR